MRYFQIRSSSLYRLKELDGKVTFESDGFDEDEGKKIGNMLHKMDLSFPAVDSTRVGAK